jgi:gamma-glutamyltranspeptidase/glutathione hydrolase
MAPTIVVRGGRPVLVAGGAGGALIIMGVLHTILDTTDFGASLADAVDAERWDTGGSRTLSIEDARVMPGVLDDLRGRGWTIKPLGEYGPRPRVQLAGADPAGPGTVGVSDSRSDHAALAQRRPAVSDG